MKIIAPRSNNLHTIEKRQDSHLLFSEFEEDALFFVDDTAFSFKVIERQKTTHPPYNANHHAEHSRYLYPRRTGSRHIELEIKLQYL